MACNAHGMPGTAFGIHDDLSHGPLDDGQARIDYMRACFRSYDDWFDDVIDAFAPWRNLLALIDEERFANIVIWSGKTVSEATFLAMTCKWLEDFTGQLLHVQMPGRGGRHYVALYQPTELAELFVTASGLTKSERANYAVNFERITIETGLLRRWERGQIIGIPLNQYDHLLLQSCTSSWNPAARSIGSAMGFCDCHNLMSDLFFSARLQHLIDAGQIQADGNMTRMRDYRVRLANV